MILSPYYRSYALKSPKYYLIRDEPRSRVLLRAYVEDTIAALAAAVRLFEETMSDTRSAPHVRDLQFKTIKELTADLLYLQKYYTIAPKDIRRENEKFKEKI